MCEHGNELEVRLSRPRETSGRVTVPVDACIADDVQKMNDQGIVTLGSCCGHGMRHPHVLIHEDSVELAIKLGYKSKPYFHGSNDYRGVHEVVLEKGERGHAPHPRNLILGISDAVGAVVEF